MIRLRNKIYEDYFIDPETAIITDKNGIVQETTIKDGRRTWKGNAICKIQMHTHNGYIKNMHVHHIDQNKLNDTLSNLIYLTPQEHSKLHANNRDELHNKKISATVKKMMTSKYKKKISEWTKAGMTPEVREKISRARRGKAPWNKGKTCSEETKKKLSKSCSGFFWWTNGETNVYSRECPDGFYRGRIIKKRSN